MCKSTGRLCAGFWLLPENEADYTVCNQPCFFVYFSTQSVIFLPGYCCSWDSDKECGIASAFPHLNHFFFHYKPLEWLLEGQAFATTLLQRKFSSALIYLHLLSQSLLKELLSITQIIYIYVIKFQSGLRHIPRLNVAMIRKCQYPFCLLAKETLIFASTTVIKKGTGSSCRRRSNQLSHAYEV